MEIREDESGRDALRDTRARARQNALRVELLESWSDIDHPPDLDVVWTQIRTLRGKGEERTARHTEQALRSLRIDRS